VVSPCAVGTAFNVRLDATSVEVLVTEGRVQLEPLRDAGRPFPAVLTAPMPRLEARQRALVPLAGAGQLPEVATLTPGEIERVLAWQHRRLDFTAAPLHEIVGEFNRRNVVQLVLIDSELAKVRISAAFRSDNIDGFVHLLEAGFGVQCERRGETEILLRAASTGRTN
jgi:transmembrane sensor